jgi:hypothetical protein
VHAIGRVQTNALSIRLFRIVDHFINIRGTEILARTTEFFDAPGIANIRVADDQVRRLILFVPGS